MVKAPALGAGDCEFEPRHPDQYFMTAEAKSNKKQDYVPYSTWSEDVIDRIKILVDECLDRFKDDKKVNSEILKMLSKLQALVEKKYKNE